MSELPERRSGMVRQIKDSTAYRRSPPGCLAAIILLTAIWCLVLWAVC